MSGFCDFCKVWHSGSCCHPSRPIPTEIYEAPMNTAAPDPSATRCAHCGSLNGGHTLACQAIHSDSGKPAQVPVPQTSPTPATDPSAEMVDYTDIANRAQDALGRGVNPSTAKAIIEAYRANLSEPAAAVGGDRHLEVLRAIRSTFVGIPEPCEELTALDYAIQAVLATPAAPVGGFVVEEYFAEEHDYGWCLCSTKESQWLYNFGRGEAAERYANGIARVLNKRAASPAAQPSAKDGVEGKVIAVDEAALSAYRERVERELIPEIQRQQERKADGAAALMRGDTFPEATTATGLVDGVTDEMVARACDAYAAHVYEEGGLPAMSKQAMRAALQSVWPGENGEGGWQSIESAPKDGTHILLGRPDARFDEDRVHVAYWCLDRDYQDGGHWFIHDGKHDHPLRGRDPSLWQPLPATKPPAGTAQGDATAWRFTFPDGYKSQWYELPAVDPLGAEIIEFQYPSKGSAQEASDG